MGSTFDQLCLRYSKSLTPTVRTSIRLWETFTFVLPFRDAYVNLPESLEMQSENVW